MNFNDVSSKYENISLVQASAGDILISLLDIKGREDVLDVGCGPGNLTRKIKLLTEGKVIGVDASEGMINEAMKNNSQVNLLFEVRKGEEINKALGVFDVVYCNSTFQWFKNPEIVLNNFLSVLEKGGRIGVQAPATQNYCPNFIIAIDEIKKNPLTSETFQNFKSPWFFLETADEYRSLFENAGFTVIFSKIENVFYDVTAEEAFNIFSSGAIAGYLNNENYSCPITEDYIRNFKNIVKASLEGQASKAGKVNLCFNRVYVIAEII